MIADRARVATLVFSEQFSNSVAWMWDHTDGFEYMGCLQGRLANDTLYVDSVELADIVSSTPGTVSGTCTARRTYFGRLHNHPSGACYPSTVDSESYRGAPHDAIDAIQCGRDRVHVSHSKLDFVAKPNEPPLD